MSESSPAHHHLITAQVVFRHKDEGDVNAIQINGVLADPGQNIPVRLLGKAQQIAQLHFRQRMPDPAIEIVDVVLLHFSYLGCMTQEEFQAAPAGTTLREKAPRQPGAQ